MNLEDRESGYLLENSQDTLMEMKWEQEEKELRRKEWKRYFGGR